MRIPTTIALTLLCAPALTQHTPENAARSSGKGRASLEMVFVIDTTGSMGGLIDGAKQKVWAIVNDVMKTPAHPSVKVGLVAYRDHGDAYVTKVLPVTADLDKVYSTLMDYKADGGGDEPEDVRQALSDGVRKAGWSQRSPSTAQILFLVGDAPPHNDYAQEPACGSSASAAVRNGIIVNTIQCGRLNGTQEAWQEIARLGEGQYFAIAQDGGVQAISTPYDHDLAKLGNRIGGTYMAYGGGGFAGGGRAYRSARAKSQAEAESKIAAGAPAAAQADRAMNKAINAYAYSGDLLNEIEQGRVKLEGMKKADLPDNLQNLSPTERQKTVDKALADRKSLKSQILALSKKRDAYLADQRRKQTGKRDGFDAAVSKALKKEAAKKGIVW